MKALLPRAMAGQDEEELQRIRESAEGDPISTFDAGASVADDLLGFCEAKVLHDQGQLAAIAREAAKEMAHPEREKDPLALEEGDIFADYIIKKKLGSGGLGVVYLVSHAKNEADENGDKNTEGPPLVALKLFRPDVMGRVERNINLFRHIKHPGLVHVNDDGTVNGVRYTVSDYYPRPDLEKRSEHFRRMTGAQLIGWLDKKFRSALEALHHLHELGIAHLDLKPANLLGGRKGEVILADLDLAMLESDEQPYGHMEGSPNKASPEQVALAFTDRPRDGSRYSDIELDPNADIYSLGATLFDLITGESIIPEGPKDESDAAYLARALGYFGQVRSGSKQYPALRSIPRVDKTRKGIAKDLMGAKKAALDHRMRVPMALAEFIMTAMHPDKTKRLPEGKTLLEAYNEMLAKSQEELKKQSEPPETQGLIDGLVAEARPLRELSADERERHDTRTSAPGRKQEMAA